MGEGVEFRNGRVMFLYGLFCFVDFGVKRLRLCVYICVKNTSVRVCEREESERVANPIWA